MVSEEKTIKKSVQQEEHQESKSNKIITNKSNAIAESSIIIKNNQEKQSSNNETVIAENSKKENVDQLLETAENKVLAQSATKKAKVKINGRKAARKRYKKWSSIIDTLPNPMIRLQK